MDYKQSGVDIDAGHEVVERIKGLARSTATPGVLSEIGSFGGLFRFDAARYRDPVLVSSADGVGTKLKVATLAGRHRGIGQDLVNHCVNDILVQGAEPLFFLDYLATGRLSPDIAVEVVEGLAEACRDNGCALLGGETAEMPGFYADGEYDVAGFIVGVVERDRLIDGLGVVPGDRLVGLASTGLHTNGYSLARALVFEQAGLGVESIVPEIGRSVADILLEPHRTYLPAVRPLLRRGEAVGASPVKAIAHITGGGITDNLPRVLPAGTAARVDRGAWVIPPVFGWLQGLGSVTDAEMFRAFNMGIGLIVVCGESDVDGVLQELGATDGAGARVIGRIVESAPGAGDHRSVTYE